MSWNNTYDESYYDPDEFHIEFASEGSALRAASKTNPRNIPCSTCDRPNMLTPKDQALGYQCDFCANAAEGGWDY